MQLETELAKLSQKYDQVAGAMTVVFEGSEKTLPQMAKYQEVTDRDSSTLLGEVCGRASRAELFEGHARSGDVRATKYSGNPLPWAPEQARRWTAERSTPTGA